MKKEHLATVVLVVAIVCILCIFFIAQMVSVSQDNGAKSKEIRIAKIEACKSITDEPLKTLCIVEGGRGDTE